MTVKDICAKQNGTPRGVLPAFTEKLVAFVDCQQNVLAWSVMAGSSEYQCGVVDYGYWPEQKRQYVERKTASPDFNKVYPGQQVEAQLYAAIHDLLAWLDSRTWKTAGGEAFKLDLVLVDSGAWTKTVNLAANSSTERVKVMPSLGVGVTAADTPFALRRKATGETHGHHFIIKRSREQGQRYVQMDVNFWKTKFHELLGAGIGSESYLSVFAVDQPSEHLMLADHWRAEYPVETTGRGRTLNEWKVLPHVPENEFLDCGVGCLVALSILGCAFPGMGAMKKRATMTLAEMAAKSRQR